MMDDLLQNINEIEAFPKDIAFSPIADVFFLALSDISTIILWNTKDKLELRTIENQITPE